MSGAFGMKVGNESQAGGFLIPGRDALFTHGQRKLVINALNEAEEHTAGYYCIPPRQWQQLPYDLITRNDREWDPLPETALARVQRLERLNTGRLGPLEFFRIQLNDPKVLSVASREKLEPDIYSFLVYILTHEMVHMIRLSKILDSACMPASAQMEESEEYRVDRISRQILSRIDGDRFRAIFRKMPDALRVNAVF